MTSTTLLRSAAIATGLVGLIDPSWTARRPAPVPVEVKAPAELQRPAGDVRRTLENLLGDRITFDSGAEPAAVVLVGRMGSVSSIDRDGVSISTVSLASPAPNVRVVAAEDPDPVRVGWTATVTGVVEGTGMAGKTSRIVLEQRGVEIAHVEHQWKAECRAVRRQASLLASVKRNLDGDASSASDRGRDGDHGQCGRSPTGSG